jgi:site-specific recombinase XerD
LNISILKSNPKFNLLYFNLLKLLRNFSHLKTKYRISDTSQNTVINAIKASYEHVLNRPREYYDIQRPNKSKSLPNVFSKEEIEKLLMTPQNIKHKAILLLIYSAGLRISEATNLRIKDIHSDEGYLFIKDSKGKRDRKRCSRLSF